MPSFNYTSRNRDGRVENGRVDAASESLAVNILQSRGLIVTGLSVIGGPTVKGAPSGIFNRIKQKDIVVFSRQLSILIAAGVPLLKALRILVDQSSGDSLKALLDAMATDVEGGDAFSSTLARYPKIFSPFYINMVRSGEVSGRLDELLDRLATQLDKDYALKNSIRNALIYPAFIITAIFGVGILMMIFVIPQITKLLIDANVPLPITTQIVIGISNFLQSYWWLVIIFVAGIILLYRWYRAQRSGRLALDRILMRIPIAGPLAKKIAIVRFSRNLSTLVLGDLPITESLAIIAPLVDNAVYEKLLIQAREDVTNGVPLSEALGKGKLMPDMVTQMIAVGERTGKLSELLERVAEFFSRDVDDLIKNLTVLIEPVVIIVLGIAIGVMISSILLPIYNYTTTI